MFKKIPILDAKLQEEKMNTNTNKHCLQRLHNITKKKRPLSTLPSCIYTEQHINLPTLI